MCFLKEMAVTGKDLIGAGIKPGPQMGEIFEYPSGRSVGRPKEKSKSIFA